MGEVILEEFIEIVDQLAEIKSYSWASVFHVLLQQAGLEQIQHEDVVMACGEGFAFAYSPYHYAPMYLGLAGSGTRLRNMFGYSTIWMKGPVFGGDIDKAWDFIKKHINLGHGIHIEGPESFLVYGYSDPGRKEDRIIKCLARWGPGLNGDVTWEEFKSFPVMFSLSSIEKTNPPLSREDNTRLLVNRIHSYQTNHPGLGHKIVASPEVKIEKAKNKEFTLSQENFGLTGFELFINDIQNEKMAKGMLQAYFNCHAINYQLWGRQWQSKWFEKRAEDYEGRAKRLFHKVAEAYREVAVNLEEFVSINVKNKEDNKMHERIKKAIPVVKEAYKKETEAVDTIAKLVKLFNSEYQMSLDETVKEALFSGMGGGDTHMNPFSALTGIDEEILHKKPNDDIMSIWGQLTHLHFWNELGLQNIKEGRPHWSKVDWDSYPPDYHKKYGNWKSFRKAILDTILEIQQVITTMDNVNKRYPKIENVSFVELARFLCSHMSYHIGQVIMLRKLFGNWPPTGTYASYSLI